MRIRCKCVSDCMCNAMRDKLWEKKRGVGSKSEGRRMGKEKGKGGGDEREKEP